MANRWSQLRAYSYVDLVLLLVAAGASGAGLLASSFLWFGFLIFLEWVHRDRGRLTWPAWTWLVLVGIGAVLSGLAALPFVALAFLYTLKKRFAPLALVSPVINGALKASLLVVADAASCGWLVAVLLLTGVRNLFGDIRDVEKDRLDGVRSAPIRCGMVSGSAWLYPLALGLTTLVWVVAGGLPWWTVPAAWAVQRMTYPLTPR